MAHCEIWSITDFTACGRHGLLETSVPSAILAISLAYAVFSLSPFHQQVSLPFLKVRKRLYSGEYIDEDLLGDGEADLRPDESAPLLTDRGDTNVYDSSAGPSSEPPSEEEVIANRFDVMKALLSPASKMSHHVEIVYASAWGKFRVCVEMFLVAAQATAWIVALIAPSLRSEWDGAVVAPVLGTILWLYLLIVVTLRVVNVFSSAPVYPIPHLWRHSTFSYAVLWIPALLSFRSAQYGHVAPAAVPFYTVQFALVSILVVLNFTARVSDVPARIIVDDTEPRVPSPEPLAPLVSLVTYQWVTPLLCRGYKAALELTDVWDLQESDYSFVVLEHWRQFRSSARFAFKLLLYFKLELLQQFLWASLDACLIFVPSLLMKKILEYVQDPQPELRGLAWFYVFCMLGVAILDTVTNGLSLFVGRRICVQMRAILVSEIYTKALKRRVGAEAEVSKQEGSTKAVETENTEDTEVGTANSKSTDPNDTANSKSGGSETSKNIGAIINLMSVDSFKVAELCAYLHFFVSGVLMTIIAVYFLYRLMGWSALVGAGVFAIVFPLNYYVNLVFGRIQKDLMEQTDARIQKINEILHSIRIIKYFAWEDKFQDAVMAIRDAELAAVWRRSCAWVISTFIWVVTPSLVTMCCFGCYVLVEGRVLTTPVAFTALSLFNLLRIPLDQLADMLSNVVQSQVSLVRIEEFLAQAESPRFRQLATRPRPGDPQIGFSGSATFTWGSGGSDFHLRDLNIAFAPGELNVVYGPTGAGKTSLLLALLGEMQLVSGFVHLPGGTAAREDVPVDPVTGLAETVAYCAQQAWLLNATVRDNIVFASDFDADRYAEVITACGLTRDLEILEAGDATEIGEKGIALSGGQKQRISLARALYSSSRHLLLDDCLSAVDSHTALWIYEAALTGPLMAGRTCVLVSHNVLLTVQRAAHVVVLRDGRVVSQGSPAEVYEAGGFGEDESVAQSVYSSRVSSVVDLRGMASGSGSASGAAGGSDGISGVNAARLAGKLRKLGADQENPVDEEEEEPLAAQQARVARGRLVDDETKADGAVDFAVYSEYVSSFGSPAFWLGIMALFCVVILTNIGQSWWVRKWAADSERQVANGIVVSAISGISPTSATSFSSAISSFSAIFAPFFSYATRAFSSFTSLAAFAVSPLTTQGHSALYYLALYSVIGLVYASLASIRTLLTFFGGLRAARELFRRLLSSVLHARVRFFDTTPAGRIINRFSKDMEAVDQELAPYAEATLYCILGCIATLLLVAGITPGFLIVAVIIGGIYYWVAAFYLANSRELKRLDAVTKSPIHQHFAETLVGVATIRAFGDERRFLRENLARIDGNNRPFFYLWVANRWLGLRADTAGALISFGAASFALLAAGRLDAGLAGLSISYALTFSENALWVVRLYAVLEMGMNSVERIREYTSVESEAAGGIAAPPGWPARGEISVTDLSLRYAQDGPAVVKNVTFHVPPGSKIGIVGRTGAGKSTIITALFRFLEFDTGKVEIDGVNISELKLQDLRRGLAIIPQDPTLFEGTLRSNLDMFGEHSDEEIFAALRRVHLIGDDEGEEEVEEVRDGKGKSGNSEENGGTSKSGVINGTAEGSNGSVKGLQNTKTAENAEHSSKSAHHKTTPRPRENENQFLDLNSRVAEGGSNLSQGQCQLMCLARALLRAPKIILLDEATASIDYETDARIQKTIRAEFCDSTILTIAHRLRSIADYDKILVMDAGEVVEYDHPYVLLAKEDSQFRSMCEDSGEFDALYEIAKKAYADSKSG